LTNAKVHIRLIFPVRRALPLGTCLELLED